MADRKIRFAILFKNEKVFINDITQTWTRENYDSWGACIAVSDRYIIEEDFGTEAEAEERIKEIERTLELYGR
jgi:hypothetical protein